MVIGIDIDDTITDTSLAAAMYLPSTEKEIYIYRDVEDAEFTDN